MATEKDSPQPKSLAQKIAAIMIDLEPVEKTGQVSFGSTKYKYVKAETLFALLQKKLAKAGIIVVPSINEIIFSPDGKLLVGRGSITLLNTDGADNIQFPWHAAAAANDDKGPNKIGTSMLKYALMRLFLISDEEDPDAEVYVDPALKAQVESALSADTEAQGKLPKGADEMTNEELAKTLTWLRNRAKRAS